jgi:Protein of unknown function (DUF1559)
MPRHDDDFEDDDRPRRRPRRDEEDERDMPPPKKGGSGVLILILVGVFVVCCGGGGTAAFFAFRGAQRAVVQAVETAQAAQEAGESRQNLSQIGTAMKDHHDAHNVFPQNSYEVRGKESRPLLSWRVHLLPFLGEEKLFKQFNLKEPWDSPTNKPLISQMPDVFTINVPRKKSLEGTTYYRGFSNENSIFEKPVPGSPPRTIRIAAIPDGLSNTVFVIEAGDAVEWTKPNDIDWAPGSPKPSLGGSASWPYFMALMGDGQVKQLRRDIPDQTLRLLIDRRDGQRLPVGWDNP